MYPDRKNCRDGFNFSERLTTSRNQEEATASSCLNVVTPMAPRLTYDTIGEFNVDSKAECGQLNPLMPLLPYGYDYKLASCASPG